MDGMELLLVAVMMVLNPEAVAQIEEEPSQTRGCHTLVISASCVIVNCSHSQTPSIGTADVANIDNRVTTLDLSSSKLKKIPDFQDPEKNFANLAYLNLSNNELNLLDGVKDMNLRSLHHLDVSRNHLRRFPLCTRQLRTLNLDLNKMSVVDVCSDIGACGKLKHLSLAGNVINNFSSSCNSSNSNDINLEVLDLSSNAITDLDKVAFNALRMLLYLNLSNNGISNLPEGVFKQLKLLEKLDLSHNTIEYLESASLETMKDLKYLDVSHNKLKRLPNAVPMMDAWIDASFNMMTALAETFNSVLYPQTVFLLGGNPFICDCDLLWLKEFFDTRKYLLKFQKTINRTKFIPVCYGPEKLKGVTWDSLDDTGFECSGLEEKETKEVKDNVEQVLAGKDLIEAAEIGEHFIMLQWNIPPDLSKSVELSYHKFGWKKDRKKIVLPSSATSYRLKKLESGAPYVICLTVTLSNMLSDCIEVITRDREDTGWYSHVVMSLQQCFSICRSRFDIIVISVGLMTIIYIFFLREKDDAVDE